ncbi:hypothetical protein [Paraburkholderia azotifigens]|uniref:Uncharacterized protein n=1 Tax=Paraburkholderia azotifigens TaxID=2057004 RepID=A0A5C6VH73_9BURK|nr:hypothetical protein [Paraburkholderia azotifigens]TXC82718.1 hypothetical protein FRZ40_19955 [Paraburkholderia azotifigens]
MSSRHDRSNPFEPAAHEAQDSNSPREIPEADLMRGLQLASDTVLRLATQTHAAVSRGDAASAQAARASLEKQLALTTRLIDELLFDGEVRHTTH